MRPPDVTCFNCGGLLRSVGFGGPEVDQFGEALPVHLDFGYGMFFDAPLSDQLQEALDEDSRMVKVILCHDCGHKMCEALPALNDLLKGGHMASNAERQGYECPWKRDPDGG